MAKGTITIKIQNGSGKVQAQVVNIDDNCNPGDELQFSHCPSGSVVGTKVTFNTVQLPTGLVLAVNVLLDL